MAMGQIERKMVIERRSSFRVGVVLQIGEEISALLAWRCLRCTREGKYSSACRTVVLKEAYVEEEKGDSFRGGRKFYI